MTGPSWAMSLFFDGLSHLCQRSIQAGNAACIQRTGGGQLVPVFAADPLLGRTHHGHNVAQRPVVRRVELAGDAGCVVRSLVPLDEAAEETAAGRAAAAPGDGRQARVVVVQAQGRAAGNGQRGKAAGRTGNAGRHGEVVLAGDACPPVHARQRPQAIQMADQAQRRSVTQRTAVKADDVLFQVPVAIPLDGRGGVGVGQRHADRVAQRNVDGSRR